MKLKATVTTWSSFFGQCIGLHDETGRTVAQLNLINAEPDAFGVTFAPAAQVKFVHQTAAKTIAALINRPDFEPDPKAAAAVGRLVAGVGDTADEIGLSVDVSCKAAAGDAFAADVMILLDRIAGTRAANRDVVLVEHATLLRLIRAAGFGLPTGEVRS